MNNPLESGTGRERVHSEMAIGKQMKSGEVEERKGRRAFSRSEEEKRRTSARIKLMLAFSCRSWLVSTCSATSLKPAHGKDDSAVTG